MLSGESAPDEAAQLVALGKRFAQRKLYREAIEVWRVAQRFEPDDSELQGLLKRAEGMVEPSAEASPDSDTAQRELRRNAIDACHFFGLAMLYAERGELAASLECLQVAKEKGPVLPFPYKLHGRMLLQQKDFSGAARELRQALRFNPFDRQVAERLGQVEYERKNFADALAATIDAFLLLRADDSEDASRLRRRIRTLRRLLDWDNRRLVRMFHDRQDRLSLAFDRLQWRRDLFLEEKGLIEKGLFGSRTPEGAGSRIALAGRLRVLDLWSHLPDEAIFHLTQVIDEQRVEAGETVFAFGSEGSDMYFVERGQISIQRRTPYGLFAMRTLGPGELLGEVNFVSPGTRTSEALAIQTSQLLRVDAEQLRELIEEMPEVGVQIYSSLWHTLSQKLRATNELLRTFFPAESVEAVSENVAPSTGSVRLPAEDVHVDSQDKVRLFREQGLSRKELLTLATFSQERHFAAGTYLFREGDPGEEMFAILDGQVRISKFIPGGGEEALSILERGDFFGEMSLLDGQPRSADARAHRGAVTVLALDPDTLREVLAMDPQASLEFLQLLCRLLSARLREIDEKVVLWQILAGHDRESDELPA